MFTLIFAFNLLFWCSQELSSPNFLSPRRLLTEKKGSYISVVECLSYTHEAPGSTPQQCLNQSQKDSLTSSRSPLPPWIQPWGSWWRADSSPVQDSHLHLCIFPELCVCPRLMRCAPTLLQHQVRVNTNGTRRIRTDWKLKHLFEGKDQSLGRAGECDWRMQAGKSPGFPRRRNMAVCELSWWTTALLFLYIFTWENNFSLLRKEGSFPILDSSHWKVIFWSPCSACHPFPDLLSSWMLGSFSNTPRDGYLLLSESPHYFLDKACFQTIVLDRILSFASL